MSKDSLEVNADRRAWLFATILFLVFLLYYSVTSGLLPKGAGPDFAVTNDISRFVYEHSALPVLPEDSGELLFTPGGTTRATRPPASYLISGFLAHLSPRMETRSFLAWRDGTSLTSALALVVVFFTLYVYFRSVPYALSGAILLGLMPQYTFIASYNNDDSAGILSAFLVILSMVIIHRRGVNYRTVAIMAASCGFVLITKFTAWLILPFAGVYTLWMARHQVGIWWRYILLSLPLVLLFGGWWILFNMYHHGWNDPLQFGIGQTIIEEYRTRIYEGAGGFSQQGQSYYSLIFGNHKNFVGESVKSLVGNLDWLKLRLGFYQYFYYTLVLLISLIYLPLALVSRLFSKHSDSKDWRADWPEIGFTGFMLAIIAFQAFMYVRFNLVHDIQIQGKYMLPVMSAVMLLFFCTFNLVAKFIESRTENGTDSLRPATIKRQKHVLSGLVVAAILVHIDAYYHYVMPFYNPPSYKLLIEGLEPVNLDQELYIEKLKSAEVLSTPAGGWYVRSFGKDPHIMMKPLFCNLAKGHALLEIELESKVRDYFVLYLDTGQGFNALQQYGGEYDAGENRILIHMDMKDCQRVRLDPMNNEGELIIKSMALSALKVGPTR
jgi:hypothetical protein